MTSWEAIRVLARNCHDEVRSKAKSDCAEDLLASAAEITGIKCEPVQAGSSLLYGAHAVLDIDFKTIWYNAELHPELSVFYRAHEYGHYWIDGLRAVCRETDLSYEESETKTQLGVQRVEGYGPKERRELQANIFAREFLLPAHKLRNWFIDEKLSASLIANKVGVIEAVVFHQLIYALFIPDPGSLNEAEEGINNVHERRLDDHQENAARIAKGPFLLDAGPGTGKTTTLLGRLKFLLDEARVAPDHILALTFSIKAADEMRSRVSYIAPDSAPHLWMGTFHAFGLELLRKYGTRINLPLNPIIIDPADSLLLLESILPELDLDHYLNYFDPILQLSHIAKAISRAKDELVNPEQYSELAQNMLARATSDQEILAAEKAIEVARAYRIYQKHLENTKKVDFGDLIFKSVELFQKHPDVREEVRNNYPHVLVDEYQDVNHASRIFLKEIAGSGRGLWVVGDMRQSIYRFRGAAPRNVARLLDDYPDLSTLSLKYNYRSQPKIIRVFETLAPHMQVSENSQGFEGWEAVRSDMGGQIHMNIAEDEDAEGKGLAQEIQSRVFEGIEYKHQAILCRTHSMLGKIAQALESEGIPVLYLGSLFEREEIRDMLSLISLCCEGNGIGLLRVAHFPEYQIPRDDVLRLFEYAREQNTAFPETLSLIEQVPNLSQEGREGFLLLRNHISDISFRTTPWSFLAIYLFARSRYLDIYLKDETVKSLQIKLAMHQFLLFAYEQSKRPSIDGNNIKKQFLHTIRRLETMRETKQLRQVPEWGERINAVRILTVHACKGLEFPIVYIPFLGSGMFPLNRKAERCPPPYGMLPHDIVNWHEEEEECLFFVALSRAQDHLYLSRAIQYDRRSNPSKLLEAIRSALPHPPDGPVTWKRIEEAPSPAKDRPRNIDIGGSEIFEADELGLYLRCPHQYFNEHILDLGTNRVESAYLRFHRCVYGVIRRIETGIINGITIDDAAALLYLAELWDERGPVEHPLAPMYYANAQKMVIRAFQRIMQGTPPSERPTWKIPLEFGVVHLKPDYVEEQPNGVSRILRIKTGRISLEELDKDIYALYTLGAQGDPTVNSDVQIFSLSTNEIKSVEMSRRKIDTRRDRYNRAILGIKTGHFLPDPGDDCPRCPFFFICPTP